MKIRFTLNIKQLLVTQGGFLALSREHPECFVSKVVFDIKKHTQVTILSEGIICFEPCGQSAKDIILSCGVHGNETAPIELCDAMVTDILLGNILLTERVLFIFANLKAMDIAKRFVDENLNRLFSQQFFIRSDNLNYEQERAIKLESAVSWFYQKPPQTQNEIPRKRFHYDMHTAIRPSKNEKFAVYPFLHAKPWDKFELQRLNACGVNTILLSGNPTGTFSYFSSHQFSAHAFTIELGKVNAFGQNDMSRFNQIDEYLRNWISGVAVSLKPYENKDFHIYKVNQVINKQKDDFTFTFDDDCPNFSDFKKGELIAKENGSEYRAEIDGEAIVFPNAQVEIGQRAALTVVPVELT